MSEGSEDGYRERIRERLIGVAEGLVSREGLGALQARRVAQDADCSIGTVYNIFGDIHGLILETNARTLADLGRHQTAAARRAAEADLTTRLTTLAIAYLDFATLNQRRWRAVFEHRLPDTKTFPEAHREDRRTLLALIEAQLESEIGETRLREDLAFALFAAVHGIVLLSLDAKIAPFDPAQCERRLRLVIARTVADGSSGKSAKI